MKKLISLLLAAFTVSSLAAAFAVPTGAVDAPEIKNAASAYLYNIENSQAIYTYNPEEKVYPTSTVKIMTGIVALEALGDRLDEKVTITSEMLSEVSGNNVKLTVGEQVTVKDLLGAMLVYGANDAAYALAYTVAGSSRDFVQMMNDKAASLAMTGTHFANPHGLHDENHYTTAYDVYLMLYAAYQHTEFQNTMSMSSYTLNMTHADGTAGTIYLSSTDKYLTGEKNAPENVTVLGGKTGTTDEAGSCLALVSQNAYGEPFISVILHASTKVELYEDMNTLLSNINS